MRAFVSARLHVVAETGSSVHAASMSVCQALSMSWGVL